MNLVTQTEEEKYERLCRNPDLYPTSLFSWVSFNDVHWNSSSWRQRELSLRHDMACILFCNMININEGIDKIESALPYLKRKIEDNQQEEPPIRRRKPEDPIPSTSSQHDQSEETAEEIYENPYEMDIECLSDSEDEASYRDPERAREEDEQERIINSISTSQISEKRFICSETMNHAEKLQVIFMKKWAIEGINNKLDIIDKEEKKLIEVKISIKPQERVEEFNNKFDLNQSIALVVYNPSKPERIAINFEDFTRTGDDKVIGFLTKRKALLDLINLNDSLLREELLKPKIIFNSKQFNTFMLEYMKHVTESEKEPISLYKGYVNPIKLITVEKLLNNLDDPYCWDNCSKAVWKGKILPPIYTEYFEMASDKDSEIIDQIFHEILTKEIEDTISNEEGVQMLKEIIEHWQFTPGLINSIVFANHKKDEKLKTLYMLGIGAKRKIFSYDEEEVVQKEFKPIERTKYETWIEDIIENLSDDYFLRGWETFINEDAISQKTIIEKISDEITDDIIIQTSRSNNGFKIRWSLFSWTWEKNKSFISVKHPTSR